MTRRHCCICGANHAQPLLVDKGLPIGRCRQCGFIYCVTIPDNSQLAEHYTALYADSEEWLQRMRRGRSLIFPAGLHALKELSAGPRLLDVGCSVGIFLDAARRAGFEVKGLELSPGPARFAREHFGLEVACATLDNAPWSPASFDVVTLWDVLEHLPEPAETLRQIARLLRAGGWLALRVPDGGFHLWKTRLARPWLGTQFTWMEAPNHLNHFRPHTLARLLEQNGYRVARIRPGSPHVYGRPFDHLKYIYYRLAVEAQRTLGWHLGNVFEVYAQRTD